MKREAQKMSWQEWVAKMSKDMQAEPMFAASKEVSHGVTFDWDNAEKGKAKSVGEKNAKSRWV
jgi:hypothetical protein